MIDVEIKEILEKYNKYSETMHEFFMCVVLDYYIKYRIDLDYLTDEIKNELEFYISNNTLNDLSQSIQIQTNDE